MTVADDAAQTAQSLAEWLGRLAFADLPEADASTRIADSVARWAQWQGWRVYRRAPSVFPLPPPLRGNSVIDVACARPGGPPVAIEIDRTDRQRTVGKLLAEAAAGRVAIWVRWGTGPFPPPPVPVHLVVLEVARRSGRWHTVPSAPPAPRHSEAVPSGGAVHAEELPWHT